MNNMGNYLKGAAVKKAVLSAGIYDLPSPSEYDEIVFYGQADGCVIDRVYGTNATTTSVVIDEYASFSKSLLWDENTYLLCEFNNSLSGGNISGIENPIEYWNIYRVNSTNDEIKCVGKVSSDKNEFNDYTPVRGNTYKYWVIGRNSDEISSPIITNDVVSDYWGWYLIDPDNDTCYAFNLAQEGGDVSQSETVNEYVTNQKFKVWSRGKLNSLQGSVSAVVYESLCDYTQTIDFIDSIREFILSDRPKIIKDNKGYVFYAFCYGLTMNDYAAGAEEVPKSISFEFEKSREV